MDDIYAPRSIPLARDRHSCGNSRAFEFDVPGIALVGLHFEAKIAAARGPCNPPSVGQNALETNLKARIELAAAGMD